MTRLEKLVITALVMLGFASLFILPAKGDIPPRHAAVSCWIGKDGFVHDTGKTGYVVNGWTVQACIFEKVRHAQVVAQAGEISLDIGYIPSPAPVNWPKPHIYRLWPKRHPKHQLGAVFNCCTNGFK